MEKYDYKRAIIDDIKDWIVNDTDIIENGIKEERDDELVNWIYDEIWAEDGVTGNGIFGYAPADKCEEYLAGNLRLAFEALENFSVSLKELAKKDTNELIRYLDCTIRCYLLDECIAAALDELEEKDEV